MEPSRIRILVVDDLTDMADSTVEFLNLWGYDAIACYSGERALACADLLRPDAVLLDLVMPRMDGFQFARSLHGLPGGGAIPLVAISGYSLPACSARARGAGIRDSSPKPVDLALLKSLLLVITRDVVLPSVRRCATDAGATPFASADRDMCHVCTRGCAPAGRTGLTRC